MRSILIRKTAYELAGAFFDNADVLKHDVKQRSSRFRLACKDQGGFVKRHWMNFVPAARQVLAAQLSSPVLSERDKETIFDALLEDRNIATDARESAPHIITLQ